MYSLSCSPCVASMSPKDSSVAQWRQATKHSLASRKSGSVSTTMHPRDSNTFCCACTALLTSGSHGNPMSLNMATRTPLKFLSPRGCANGVPGWSMEIGECWSKPASTLRKKAQSETLRATGPATDRVNHPRLVGTSGTRPGDGRMPTTLQKFGGLRNEPPMSLPSASGTMPHASATAPPPVLPPQVLVKSYGFRVAPKTLLNVCEPSPNSGTFVLPITIPPAAFSRCTTRQSKSGTKSRCSGEPNVVRIPAVSCKSLTPTGIPCKGPSNFPLAKDSSAAAACAINCSSATKVTIAFTLGFTRPICFKCACMTSRADNFFSRINLAISTARIKQISAEDSEVFAEVGNVAEVALASMGLADSSGVMAADTAALVPNFNASRRLILLIRSSQTGEEQY